MCHNFGTLKYTPVQDPQNKGLGLEGGGAVWRGSWRWGGSMGRFMGGRGGEEGGGSIGRSRRGPSMGRSFFLMV